MINSGRARALEIARELIARPDWAVTFTAGRDATLQAQLTELTRHAADRCTVLGWTDRIPELLMTHHVVISKAGGATTQESVNALCPMIVNQIVPGQEEGNWELLRRHSAGAFADEPKAIVTTLERAFADDALLWRSWRKNLRRIARPDASRTITAQVLAVASRTASAKIAAA
jgi:processive 1,2-diacylglycerol beta-glucosyltransferase